MTYQRFTITPEQQAGIDSWKSAHESDMHFDPVSAGTNLEPGDQGLVSGLWAFEIVAGDGATAPWVFVPGFIDPEFLPEGIFNWGLIDHISELVDVNGNPKSVYPEQPEQPPEMMMARTGDAADPQKATRTKQQPSRTVEDSLRDALKRIDDPHKRNGFRDVLRKAGALKGGGKDDA